VRETERERSSERSRERERESKTADARVAAIYSAGFIFANSDVAIYAANVANCASAAPVAAAIAAAPGYLRMQNVFSV
jgi:hypothetical protein